MKTTYIDSNYWIYWFDERLPEHRFVGRVMQSTLREGVVVNTVTLMEVAHYFRSIPKAEFNEKIGNILSLSTLKIIDFTLELMQVALSFVPQYGNIGLGARDCVILATMDAIDSKVLLSHDKAFSGVKDIILVDEIV